MSGVIHGYGRGSLGPLRTREKARSIMTTIVRNDAGMIRNDLGDWVDDDLATDAAREVRLAVAFGGPISEAARGALTVVARYASEREVAALAAEIHNLSVKGTNTTPAKAHLDELIA